MSSLLGLDPQSYVPHPVHSPDFGYPETNCWTDVLIELLHAHRREPLAGLGCTLALDHEGDQFTFFKPRQDEIEALYGIDIHELQPYRSYTSHLENQLAQGNTLILEVDAWWLPDTAGVSYRTAHAKTSIAVDTVEDDRLVYFHGSGLHELRDEDRERVLVPDGLPGYVEVVRFDAGPPLEASELRAVARELLRDNLLRRPARSPFLAFGEQLGRELDDVLAMSADDVHLFAFATTRMAGAAMALAAAHVRWVLGAPGIEAADAFDAVAHTTRTLTMRLMRRKPFDASALVDALNADWSRAHGLLDDLLS
ncbi:MAG: DUF1839 family protein [Mycobacteriales bacterium]